MFITKNFEHIYEHNEHSTNFCYEHNEHDILCYEHTKLGHNLS